MVHTLAVDGLLPPESGQWEAGSILVAGHVKEKGAPLSGDKDGPGLPRPAGCGPVSGALRPDHAPSIASVALRAAIRTGSHTGEKGGA